MATSYLFPFGRRKAIAHPLIAAMTARLEGYLLLGVWTLLRLFSPDRASLAGAKTLSMLGPLLAKNRHVLYNLSVALPNSSLVERKRIARSVWGETGRVFAEFPHLEAICGAESETRLEVIDRYGMDSIVKGERVAVFVTAHFSNWELAAGICRKIGFKLAVLHTNFSNRMIDELLMENRKALGCDFIPKAKGVREIVKSLQNRRSVGIVMDQRHDEGELLTFFDRPARTGTAAAAIACKFGVDLVPVKVERKSGANYRITFMPAVPAKNNLPPKENARVMTRELLRIFEEWISQKPEMWMCLKRRWPKDSELQTGY